MTDLAGMTIDQALAEAQRRRERNRQGLPMHDTPEEIAARAKEDDDRQERLIQAEIVKLYRANGFTVWEGLKDRRKVRIQPGMPDLTLFHARLKWHGYQEVKTPSGELRPDQKDFRDVCLASGVPHFVGGVAVARLVIEAVINSPPTPRP